MSRTRCCIGLVLVSVLGLSASAAQKSAPALPDVLKAAGDYVQQYSQKLQAVSAQEEFLQMDTGGGQINHTRRLSADVVWVGLDGGVVGGFRDTYAIDTKPLHERSDRLVKLFEAPPGPPVGALQTAQRYTDESVSQYVSSNLHTLDVAVAPLELVREKNQQRVTFKLDSVKTMDGASVAILKFTENAAPSLLPIPVNVPVSGRLWIDVATGALRQSEVIVSNKQINIRVSASYTFDKTLNLWLPAELTQLFDISAMGPGGPNGGQIHQSLETHVKYTKYHQVPIDLSKIR